MQSQVVSEYYLYLIYSLEHMRVQRIYEYIQIQM